MEGVLARTERRHSRRQPPRYGFLAGAGSSVVDPIAFVRASATTSSGASASEKAGAASVSSVAKPVGTAAPRSSPDDGEHPLAPVAGRRSTGQNELMPELSHHIASNGRTVTRLVTSSGVAAYVADEVPLEALIGLAEKLRSKAGLPADRRATGLAPSRRNGGRALQTR